MLKLKIVTPDGVKVEDNVEAVYGQTVDGSIGILPNHIPLLTPLKVGVLSYLKSGRKAPLAVMGGLMYTDGKSVTVLADAAELSSEIDVARAQTAKNKAEAALNQPGNQSIEAMAKSKQALTRAKIRLMVAGSPN